MFQRWFKSQGFKTQQACADFLKLHKSTVSRLLKDPNYRPDKITAMHIEQMTEGVVTVKSWNRAKA